MTAPPLERTYTADLPETELDDGTRDPGDVAHYVDQRFDQDVAAAMIEGTEVVALCGYRWVPHKDPRRLPVCRPCVDELARITGAAT